jgi:hypothetical protein
LNQAEKSSDFGFKPRRVREVSNKWSCISAKNILEWGEDDEPDSEAIRGAIRGAVKKTLDELYPKLEKLASVLKPLCKLPASAT